MNAPSTRLIRIVGSLLLGIAVAGAPVAALAGGHFGGGGGGGGHFGGGGGGGGHVGGGGGHFGGGGGGHFSGGHAAVSGPSGGGHFASAPGAHSGYGGAHSGYGGPHYGYGGPHYATPHYAGAAPGPAYHAPVHGGFASTSAAHAAGRYSGGYAPGWNGWRGGGYWYGGRYWHGWGGGYWHGVFWPQVYFAPGFAWFLPVLPYGYATYWWGGVPYYYWNDAYYTWSPADSGYVATDPPPVADGSAGDSSSGYGEAAGGSDVYLYPRNGQSDAQTQQDRYECHSWAVSQTGFDPTRSSQQSGSASAYRRAMVACLDARGYSAR